MLRDEPTPSASATGKAKSEDEGAARFKDSQSGGTGAVAGGKVYMGSPPPVRAEGHGYIPAQPIYMTKKEAYDAFNKFQGKQLRDFINAGQVAGQLQDDAGFLEGQALWKKLVDASYGLTAAGNKISPQDVLASYLGSGPLGVGKKTASPWQVEYRGGRKFLVNSQTGEVKYQGPRFETTYSKSIDLTDPTTAKAIAQSVFQQLLHRDPGKGELGSWANALNSAEQSNPVTTNTTVEYDPNTGEPIGQSSTSTGGFGADAKQYLAEQRIKGTKEYGATQAATTYANALENAIFNNPYGSL